MKTPRCPDRVVTGVQSASKMLKLDSEDRQLYSGLIRLHILYHSVQGPVFGLAIIEELARHGYKLSSGSLYPMLHAMERKGYLRSAQERSGKSTRRVYRATARGRQVLKDAEGKVRELFGELFEHDDLPPSARRAGKRTR